MGDARNASMIEGDVAVLAIDARERETWLAARTGFAAQALATLSC